MKVKQLLLTLVILLVSAVGLFANDVILPPDWSDLYNNYGIYFATAGGVAGIAAFLGELVIRYLKFDLKWQKVTTVWVLAIVASLAGAFVFNVGYLAEANWWETLIWGAFSGLLANGIWSSNALFLKSILEFFVGLIKAKAKPVG